MARLRKTLWPICPSSAAPTRASSVEWFDRLCTKCVARTQNWYLLGLQSFAGDDTRIPVWEPYYDRVDDRDSLPARGTGLFDPATGEGEIHYESIGKS